LCTMFDVIGKSAIFPITEQKRTLIGFKALLYVHQIPAWN